MRRDRLLQATDRAHELADGLDRLAARLDTLGRPAASNEVRAAGAVLNRIVHELEVELQELP